MWTKLVSILQKINVITYIYLEIHIRKFVRNSIKRKRVTPNFKPEKLIDPPKPLYIHNIDETTIFFNS